jgi:multiple antibiotic resistance protein
MSLIEAAVLHFFVMDPLGTCRSSSRRSRTFRKRQRAVIVRELVIALVILVIFLFAGRYILAALHVSPQALTIGGGVILMLIALRMIFPSAEHSLQEPVHEEPFVVPLAIPYTAGPSTMATQLLFMSREPERWPVWLGALCLAWFASAIILYFSGSMRRVLGERG